MVQPRPRQRRPGGLRHLLTRARLGSWHGRTGGRQSRGIRAGGRTPVFAAAERWYRVHRPADEPGSGGCRWPARRPLRARRPAAGPGRCSRHPAGRQRQGRVAAAEQDARHWDGGVTGEHRAGPPVLRRACERGFHARVRPASDRRRPQSFLGPGNRVGPGGSLIACRRELSGLRRRATLLERVPLGMGELQGRAGEVLRRR